MKSNRTFMLIGALAFWLVSFVALAQVEDFQPVTGEMLENPDPEDWLMYRRTYDAWGHSPLDQITTENVQNLDLAWSWAMEPGQNQPTPLVHDGVMYLPNADDVIQAIDAATGDLIWEYRRELPEDANDGQRTRSIAIHDDKIYHATADAYMIALNAETGAVEWETELADYTLGYTNTSGPIVADGKVINGINGCSSFYEESCFITAHDVETGEELWRTFTIAQPDQEGGDTWADLPLELRGGGDAWITGSYDPELDLIYWGTAQPKPWVPASRGMTTEDDALYTNSTLALNPDSGEIEWHHQYVPGEANDFDETYEQVLIDIDDTPYLFQIGKHGILWKLNRETGEFVDYFETVFQNVFTDIDEETGRPTYREDIQNAEVGEWVSSCPSTAGGKDWQATSYSPEEGLLIIPLSQTCLEIQGRETELVEGSGGSQANRHWFEMPGTDGNVGKLAAIDVDTMEEVWSVEMRESLLTGILTTAGGVTFSGDVGRNFVAYDTSTGEELWRTRLNTSVQGFPITYMVDGEQYVAMSSGLGGGSPRRIPTFLTPEIRYPETGNSLFVFKLE